MGGFVLNVSPLHDYHGVMTLTHHAMLVLAKDGLFLPMSDDSIRDKSKADYLAKALVFFQVSFLVVQTIARKSQALPTSLLEIHTLVHVVCAVGMYVAWIRKPLDIKDPTDISLNIWSNPDLETGLRWQKAIANILVHSHGLSTWSYNGGVPCDLMAETLLAAEYVSFPTFRERNVELISASSTQKDEAQLLDSSFDGLSLKFCTRELVPASIAFFDNLGQSQEQKAMTKKRFEGPPWNPDCVRDWYPCTSPSVKLPVSLSLMTGCALSSGVGPATDNGLLMRLHFTKKALRRWLLAFGDKDCWMGSRRWLVSAKKPEFTGWQGRLEKSYLETRMSSFAAGSSEHDIWTSLLACTTCIVYGGIHAVGWNFVFATQTEQLLWRISCPLLIVLGVPMYSFIKSVEGKVVTGFFRKLVRIKRSVFNSLRHGQGNRFLAFSHVVCFLCFLPYCAARIFLVVEAFISLRHVPEGVYQLVEWTTYIPHL
ncbi:hypothetical protein EG328_000084 [Venturia inaequalis]|uniref:Uncharacterized protein n=1 Tax=Venturia inaequalis TaxID=5025 RepID=A0A8H3VKL1_VENIN|nr:hypothetical protein EG328_000084 [Venturia inaequalis]